MKRPSSIPTAVAGLVAKLPSEHSRRSYEGDWERFTKWLKRQKLDVIKVRPRDVESYTTFLQRHGKSQSTVGHALSVVRECYGALVRDEIMKYNPAREVKTPRVDGAPKTPWLNEQQVKKLLAAPNKKTWEGRRNYLCLCLLFGLGFRRAEIARMRVEDFKGNTVTAVVKGRKTITVRVPAWLAKTIESWKKLAKLKSGPLLPFSPDDPEALTGDMVYNIVKRAGVDAKLPLELVTPHALRRTNITIAGERGVDLKKRQLAVGHSSSNTTERYDRAREATKSAPGDVFADLVGG